jgi:hypothetical protein
MLVVYWTEYEVNVYIHMTFTIIKRRFFVAVSVPFKAWLVQPGNHRLLHGIQESLASFLARDVRIHSWSDLYWAFEESVLKNENTTGLFTPIFEKYPPMPENGATLRQVQLYRGVKVDPHNVVESSRGENIKVIYRGQKVDKVVSVENLVNRPQGQTRQIFEDKSARYYRGAKLEE